MTKYFYISTPIYYPSGRPHIGHAFSTILADVLSRYKKMFNYEVFFVTGTDEHGQKIETNSFNENMKPIDYVNKNVKVFLELWKELNIDYSRFIRTTDKNHIAAIQKIFSYCIDNNYTYLANWEGLYCVSCEENYTVKSAIKNNDDINTCVHGHKLILRSEESYFLKMSEFSNWIISYLNKHNDFIFPTNRRTELMNNFLENSKLEDLSISRSTFSWGVKVKENKKHVVYVWIDALFSYLTSMGYLGENDIIFKKFWQNKNSERVHILSKEITRFHCIYWPILLKIMNLNQPTKILSHGWIVTKEGKMSKSLGNVIDPFSLISKYGSDTLRYSLIKDISLKEDSTFSIEKLEICYNTDLANNYGNLISRIKGLIKKYSNNKIPKFIGYLNEFDNEVKLARDLLKKNIASHLKNLNVTGLVSSIVDFENVLNNYIETSKPWVMFKDGKKKELNNFLSICYNSLKIIVFLLSPILVDNTKEICRQLNIIKKDFVIEKIYSFKTPNNSLIKDGNNIFDRIEKNNEK
ncbi:MAG: methionine--tRNA ligase [Malacoplasma sp.]